jgi:N-methylhydantoinase A
VIRLGIDIGGTFTDVVLIDDETGRLETAKAPTTISNPSVGAIEAVAAAVGEDPAERQGVGMIVHGTTLVANAIIERKGEPTALLTTKGFRDVLEIGREHRYEMYDLMVELPEPLVPRNLRLEIDERTLADGTVVRGVDRESVELLTSELAKRGIGSVAVALIHSYRNPEHEQTVGRIISEVVPELRVSLSADVAPEIKEYERTYTTVCNAYVQKLVDTYLEDLERRIRDLGLDAPLMLMLSSGGTATVDTGRRFPVRLLESGPVGGVTAAARVSECAGFQDVLAFDMGGTTAKISIIEQGQPRRAPELEVARCYRFTRGSGLPVRIPVIDMVEIGAGGGSIGRVNPLGLLAVGPDSAGADPGPVCYGRGGDQPTVTDADLVLGYLGPDSFLGGRMSLDIDRARTAIRRELAEPLGLSITEAAWGVHRLVDETMAGAARVHAGERGKDLRRFTLFASGGAGPVHACGVADLLGSPGVIVPPKAGVGSALGLLSAPLAFDAVHTSISGIDEVDWREVATIIDRLEQRGRRVLASAGLPSGDMAVSYSADIRYVGQGHEITVPLDSDLLARAPRDHMAARFATEYAAVYGRASSRLPVEVVNWRVGVSGPRPPIVLGTQAQNGSGDRPPEPTGDRLVYLFEARDFVRVPVYDRYSLGTGNRIAGPAIVEETESTTVVAARATARVDSTGSLIIDLGGTNT